mmetsp:Transcript_29160/g.43936  ORF Transcript_29160/g.43936 Transcript_29160/m.43936 type:complete len:133 (-) Transcript_29160:4092-4490(-)
MTRVDGAFQQNVSELYIDETVTKRIWFQVPEKAIFYDIDGTLSGRGEETWISRYYPHFDLPGCTYDDDKYFDAVVCDGSNPIRRITFYDQIPFENFFLQYLYILPYDDDIVGDMTTEELTTYEETKSNYGVI